MSKDKKIFLDEREIPRRWYNIQADMPNKMAPPLHPATKQPITAADLAPIFPLELIKQEVSQERWIDIPDEVAEKYRIWRPTPLIRAYELECGVCLTRCPYNLPIPQIIRKNYDLYLQHLKEVAK